MSELELIDAILRDALELQRLSAFEEREAEVILRELEDDLRRLLNSGQLSGPTRWKVAEIISQAERAINQRYGFVAKTLDTRGLMLMVADRTVDALKVISPQIGRPTPETLASLADDVLIDGAPAKAWWDKQAEDTAFKFAAQVRQGVINGETVERITQRIVGKRGEPGIMVVARRNARTLVHSSVMTAANDARLATFRKNARFIKGVRWLSTLDSRTCLQCFPAGTKVISAGIIKNVFRSKYSGQMFVITTAAGQKLRGTANHPILTARGFLPLHEVKERDQVFNTSGLYGSVVGGGQNIDVPTDIAEVFDALSEPSLSDISRKRSAAVDFYGDGEFLDGEIDIVSPNGHLGGDGIAFCAEGVGDPSLGFVEARRALIGEGSLNPFFDRAARLGLSPEVAASIIQCVIDGRLRSPDDLGDLEWLFALIEKIDDPSSVPLDVYVRLASLERWHYSMSLEQAGDGSAGRSVLAGDSPCGHSFTVEPDHVVSVVSEFESCHVYTLETSLGIYTAEGLLVKNCAALDGQSWTLDGKRRKGTTVEFMAAPAHFGCRCVLTGIPKSEPASGPTIGARASKDGPLPAGTTMQEFLKRQSPEFVDKVLGEGRAKLFEQGKITVRDLVSGTGRELSLAELTER